MAENSNSNNNDNNDNINNDSIVQESEVPQKPPPKKLAIIQVPENIPPTAWTTSRRILTPWWRSCSWMAPRSAC